MSVGQLRFVRLPAAAWRDLISPYAPRPFKYVVESTEFTRAWRLALVLVDEVIVGAVVLRRYGRPGFGQDGLEVVAVEEFRRGCPWAELEATVPQNLRPNLLREDGAPLPPVTGRAVEDALDDLVEGAADVLARVAGLMPGPVALGGRASIVREQRDAIALGLEIAGIDSRDALGDDHGDLADPVAFGASFLNGWARRRVSEPAMIRHDSTAFDGWLAEQAQQFDAETFRDPRDPARKVTVLYADKEALERQTGTDLLYYRHYRPGFILVQYKRMRSDRPGSTPTYYPDPQLQTEIDRYRSLPVPDAAASVEEWRLTEDAYFVKLVRDDVGKRAENRLVLGMYLPLGLVDLLLHEGQDGRRPRGWSMESIDTYLSNTEFLHLAKQGYIGTRGATSEQLKELIGGSLDDGRGVVVAVDQTDPESAARLRHG